MLRPDNAHRPLLAAGLRLAAPKNASFVWTIRIRPPVLVRKRLPRKEHPGKLHSLDTSSRQPTRSAPQRHSLECKRQKKASAPEKETEACHTRERYAYLSAESAISMADLNKS